MADRWQDKIFLRLRESRFLALVPKAVPISNSEPSLAMRAAALENAISKQLSEVVFVDLRQQSSSNVEINALRMLDDKVTADSERRSALLRSLLATSPDLQTRRATDLVANFAEPIVSMYSPILDLSNAAPELIQDLSTLATDANELWLYAQRYCHKVEAVSADQIGMNWGYTDDYGHVSDRPDHQAGGPLAILFPSFQIRSASEGSAIIHDGCALWSDQPLTRSGVEEHRIQEDRVMGAPSNNHRRIRRVSTSHVSKSVQTPLKRLQA